MDPRPALGVRARALGHDVQVEQDGRRFRLVCSCGFVTPINMKRKTAFDAATQHLVLVVNNVRTTAGGNDESTV